MTREHYTIAALWLLSVVLGAAAWDGWSMWSALGGVIGDVR